MKIWSHSFSTRIEGQGDLIKKANGYFEALEVQGFSPKSIQTYAFVLMPIHIENWKLHFNNRLHNGFGHLGKNAKVNPNHGENAQTWLTPDLNANWKILSEWNLASVAL